MDSLQRFAREKLARLEAQKTKRALVPQRRSGGVVVERQGKRFISFSCNDTLGLSHDPRVIAAATAALTREGCGAGGSRLVTGNAPSICALEDELSAFRDTERTLVFGSGTLANLGVIPALVDKNDLVVLDERAHSCLFSGARLARATVKTFAHNDADALKAILTQHRHEFSHVLVAVEGVYSMDGDLAPLPAVAGACSASDAWLLVDDAHAIGTLGDGKGTAAHFGLSRDDVPLQIATLSKAFGAYGGILGASHDVVELLISRARTFVYSTGLPPAAAGAARAALSIIAEDSQRRRRPLQHAQTFAAALGLAPPDAHLVPLIIGSSADALAAQAQLEEQGFVVTAIRAPTVAEGTARLRVAFSALHDDSMVLALAEACRPLVEGNT